MLSVKWTCAVLTLSVIVGVALTKKKTSSSSSSSSSRGSTTTLQPPVAVIHDLDDLLVQATGWGGSARAGWPSGSGGSSKGGSLQVQAIPVQISIMPQSGNSKGGGGWPSGNGGGNGWPSGGGKGGWSMGGNGGSKGDNQQMALALLAVPIRIQQPSSSGKGGKGGGNSGGWW